MRAFLLLILIGYCLIKRVFLLQQSDSGSSLLSESHSDNLENFESAIDISSRFINSPCSHLYPCRRRVRSYIQKDELEDTQNIERKSIKIKDVAIEGDKISITKIDDLNFELKHPIKTEPPATVHNKRKQVNKIRHKMQSSFHKGKQMSERSIFKRFHPSHFAKISRGDLLASQHRYYAGFDIHMNDEHHYQRYFQSNSSIDGSNMREQLETDMLKQEPYEPSHLNTNWLRFSEDIIGRNPSEIGEKFQKISMNAEKTHILPTPLPLHSKVPDITWGRAQTQTAAFADPNPVNVTARDGEQARLPCTVLRLDQGEVSWIRKRDLHILTVGRTTYTSDQRFRVLHGEGSLDWTLIIGPTTLRDAGTYECQVSSKPKISRPIHLIIAEVERAEIQGPPEVFIRNGSTISLTCVVKSKSEDLGSVVWTKEGVILDYDSPRGGVSLEVEKTPTKATTKLFITKARKSDSGTYICSPQFAQPASVVVHVVNGEESAAVQTSSGMQSQPSIAVAGLSLLLALCPIKYIECIIPHLFNFIFLTCVCCLTVSRCILRNMRSNIIFPIVLYINQGILPAQCSISVYTKNCTTCVANAREFAVYKLKPILFLHNKKKMHKFIKHLKYTFLSWQTLLASYQYILECL